MLNVIEDSSRSTVNGELHDAHTERVSWNDNCLVLLIDDQQLVAYGLKKILSSQEGLDLHYCSEGRDAVRIAKKIQPTVILLDLIMPELDGTTLLRDIRAEPSLVAVPVVMLSSEEDATRKAECFNMGANDYINKWPEPVELLARLRYHSRFYHNRVKLGKTLERLRASQLLLTEKNIELEQLATHDGLTGLFNRHAFNVKLNEEVNRAFRNKQRVALLMIDVDHFKLYNDHYGHLQGDDCLRQIADVFKACARRPADTSARFGGEEFVVVLPDVTSEGAQIVAENIIQMLESKALSHETSPTSEFVTASIGIVISDPEEELSPEILTKRADEALYQAKDKGRNRFCLAPPHSGSVNPDGSPDTRAADE